MIKIKFKNGINGVSETWVPPVPIYNINSIKRRIESRNPGEAGVIVYDKLSLTFDYEQNNPVYNAFSGNLSAAQRYIIELFGIKSNKSESKLFEGLVDFSSIEWPDLEKKISFNVLDKLSSLNLIVQTETQRGIPFNFSDRVDPSIHHIYMFSGRGSNNMYPGHDWNSFGNCGDESIIVSFQNDGSYWGYPLNQTQLAVKRGETIEDATGKRWFVRDAWLAQVPQTIASIIGYYVNATWVRLIEIQEPGFRAFGLTNQIFKSNYYDKDEEYIDIIGSADANGRYPVDAFDALKIIRAIIEKVWGNIVIINKSGSDTFPIALEYFTQLIDENPFGEHPLDAIKTLAASMQCYIFFNKNGELVIQKKNNIQNNTVRNFTQFAKKSGGRKKYFWDKLVDAVTVTVKSGKVIDGVSIEGKATVKKYAGIQPRNEIKLNIIAPNTVEFNQTALDTYALQVASEIMNFYGKRHYYFSITTHLLDDMLDWDLLDLIDINGERYFILSIDIDIVKNIASFELVSVNSYDYDYQQARPILSEEKYNSTISSTGTSSSGTGITINLIAAQPLELFGSVISLKYSDNFKLTEDNKLDTIQDIKKTSTTIELARLGIGGPPDAVFRLKNYNDEWILGNQKIDGVQAIGGDIDLNFRQKIYGNLKVTGNISIDGNIYIGGSINQVNVEELNVSDKVIKLNKGGDNTTALYGGIEILGLNDNLLGSIKYTGVNWNSDLDFNLNSGKVFKINNIEVLSSTTLGSSIVNSSLTKVGTLTQGIWNATPINGQYINYNTTNLKVTSNQLNTIQDISITSTPSFAQLLLSNQATTTSQAVRADRIIETSTPLFGGGDLTSNRNIGLNYNTTHFTINNGQLTAQNIVASSNNGVVITSPFTLGSTITINTPQDIRTSASPSFINLTLTGKIDQQGTANSEFGSQYLLPKQNYYGNLGSLNKKWLTLHAAELWVENLVAQDTIATIGGRVLVGPTTTLVTDLSAASTTINVKHNQMVAGDIIYMEANGKVEFMRINSSASGSSGNYYYNVIRDLDGTGANDWYAGDAVFNTGQTGNGFIDLYSIRGIKSVSQRGPSIVGNVRNSSTYNDWSEYWAIGNLNGLYGYTSDTFGVGLGKYANSSSFITIDSTSGIRLRYRNSSGTITDKIKLDMAGNVYIENYLQVGSAANDINNGNTTISGSKITTGTITLSHLNFSVVQPTNVIASINASSEGLKISGSKIRIDGTVEFASGYDPSQKISIGGAAADINNNTTTISGNKIRTGIIQSNNYSSTSGTKIELDNGNITFNAPNGTVVLYGTMTNYATGLNVTGKTSSGSARILVQAGSYNDAGYARYGISIWDNNQNAFLLNIGYEPTQNNFVAKVGTWNLTKDWLADDAQKVIINATQKSIYARPLGSGASTKYVMLGQTHNGVDWTGYFGISAVDGNNNWLFRIDDYEKRIAGWNFDYQRFYNISGSTGIELSTSTIKTITTGFAVWNPSSPKMFLGTSSSYLDWNNINANKLTVSGDILSSRFSTISDFNESNNTNFVIIAGEYLHSRKIISSLTYDLLLSGNFLSVQASDIAYHIAMYAETPERGGSRIQIDYKNVPKFHGILSSAPTVNCRPGDFYINTSNKVYIYDGSTWIILN